MKRIRIWLNSFSLIQQYLLVVSLGVLVFVVFIFQFLYANVNSFTNAQMYSYLHRSQTSYINALNIGINFDDSNASHYYFDTETNAYSPIPKLEDLNYLSKIDPLHASNANGQYDGVLMVDGDEVLYSLKTNKNRVIVSIINNEYRADFKNAIATGIVNVELYFVVVLFAILMVWVYSLIQPLNYIRNYIQKVKDGEKVDLQIRRNDEIGEVAEAVVRMNEELLGQQRIREEMIQNISHDLKTPIATIKSYSESIKDGVYPYDTLEKSVDVIIEHAERLEKKVYSLITYNKIGYLEDTTVGDNLLMLPVIEKAILSCQVLRTDIEFDTSELVGGVYFHGEEEAWRTVVENLIENALRYAKTKISITLSEDLLEVYNDGELMPKERIEKLFKPYEKGNKGNFGLGLSIVKRVCDTYGYNVVGENKTDGVVFRIYRNTSTKTKQTI
ncbi:MAG: HAMP domain-containing sensor histidine kinase [Erysipelotrichaceae bacterium]|nr:HAMP domain-containing sensor histidine kinase [Erysipelotrichaceae bacterium]